MDIRVLRDLHNQNQQTLNVSIHGKKCGSFFIYVSFQKMHIQLQNTDEENPKALVFRSPIAAIKRLEGIGIYSYRVNLSEWDRSNFFDRDKHLYQTKKKKVA